MVTEIQLQQAEEEARKMAYWRFIRNMKGVRLTLQDGQGCISQNRFGTVEEAQKYAQRQIASGNACSASFERYDRGKWLSL